MSGRRPHWDDDLIEAVACAIVPDEREREVLTHEMIYSAIAAVEDWQDARGDAIDGRSLTEAIFAVQRVRDVCASSHVDDKGKKVVFLDRILRALDGGAE